MCGVVACFPVRIKSNDTILRYRGLATTYKSSSQLQAFDTYIKSTGIEERHIAIQTIMEYLLHGVGISIIKRRLRA